MFEQYKHHGALVSVRSDLKGRHREHCLCYQCANFKPEEREGNCHIANKLYQLCVVENIVTPVFECPEFVAK